MAKDFRQRTLGALKWSTISQALVQVARIGSKIVLLNLLTPREFGLVQLVLVLTGFADLYAELGLGAALVQRPNLTEAHKSSIFWVNVVVGLLLTALCAASAPLVAGFYDEPDLVTITMALGAVFSFRGLQVVHRSLLTKELLFRSLALAQISTTLFSAGLAIAAAAGGWGVWSLVVWHVAEAASSTVAYWMVSPWRPKWMYDWSALKELLGFSTALLGTRTLSYWTRNGDNLLIGKFIGSGALGLYASAYSLMMMPVQQGARIISNTLFPSLSLIQSDKERVKSIYIRVAGVIACITVPIGLGTMVTAHHLVPAILGQQWAGAVPILQILAPAGVIQSIATLNGNLFLSQGQAGLQFRLNMVTQPLTLACIGVGVMFGVQGVAIGVVAATVVSFAPSFYFAGGLVGLRVGDLLKRLQGVLAIGTVMAATVLATDSHVAHLDPRLAGGIEVLVGVMVYSALLLLFRPQPVWDLMALRRKESPPTR